MRFFLVAFLTMLTCLLSPYAQSWWQIPKHQCQRIFHRPTEFDDMNMAMLCGEDHIKAQHDISFKKTGLFHLIVVAGLRLHLFWMTLALLLRRRNFYLEVVLGFMLALSSGFGVPVARGLGQSMLYRLQNQFRLFWRPQLVVFTNHILFILFCPKLFSSVSLILCSLGTSSLLTSKNHWRGAVAMYVSSFPVFAMFATPHPFSIVCNVLLVFPVIVGMFVCTLLDYLKIDGGWRCLFWILDQLAQFCPEPTATVQFPPWVVGLYAIIVMGWRVHNEQNRLPLRPFYFVTGHT